MFGDGPIDGPVRCRACAARAVSGSALRSLSGTSDGGGGEGGTGVSRGRMGGGNVGGVSDGGAVGARERVFFRLGRARARGSPRACVRLCRCLSTAPAARNAMPLKGVGGIHSPSNISSPSKCSSARWAAPPPRSSDICQISRFPVSALLPSDRLRSPPRAPPTLAMELPQIWTREMRGYRAFRRPPGALRARPALSSSARKKPGRQERSCQLPIRARSV